MADDSSVGGMGGPLDEAPAQRPLGTARDDDVMRERT